MTIRGWGGGVVGWGEEPPFHMPVFVVTHYEREPLTLADMTFVFVTEGIESALDQARTAAAGKDVVIGGGASVINQYLAEGLVDELELDIVPLILGGGSRLFEGLGPDLELEQVRAIEGAGLTHIKYRVSTREFSDRAIDRRQVGPVMAAAARPYWPLTSWSGLGSSEAWGAKIPNAAPCGSRSTAAAHARNVHGGQEDCAAQFLGGARGRVDVVRRQVPDPVGLRSAGRPALLVGSGSGYPPDRLARRHQHQVGVGPVTQRRHRQSRDLLVEPFRLCGIAGHEFVPHEPAPPDVQGLLGHN